MSFLKALRPTRKDRRYLIKKFDQCLNFIYRKLYLRVRYTLLTKMAPVSQSLSISTTNQVKDRGRGFMKQGSINRPVIAQPQELINAGRVEGRVKFYREKEGFGFVWDNSGERNREVFVHVKQFTGGLKTLGKNDLISFEMRLTEKGVAAEKIELIEKAPSQPKPQGQRHDRVQQV